MTAKAFNLTKRKLKKLQKKYRLGMITKWPKVQIPNLETIPSSLISNKVPQATLVTQTRQIALHLQSVVAMMNKATILKIHKRKTHFLRTEIQGISGSPNLIPSKMLKKSKNFNPTAICYHQIIWRKGKFIPNLG